MKAMTCTRLGERCEPLYVGQMRRSVLKPGEHGLELIGRNLEDKAHTPNTKTYLKTGKMSKYKSAYNVPSSPPRNTSPSRMSAVSNLPV